MAETETSEALYPQDLTAVDSSLGKPVVRMCTFLKSIIGTSPQIFGSSERKILTTSTFSDIPPMSSYIPNSFGSPSQPVARHLCWKAFKPWCPYHVRLLLAIVARMIIWSARERAKHGYHPPTRPKNEGMKKFKELCRKYEGDGAEKF